MSHTTWTWYSHRVGKEMTVARWGEVGPRAELPCEPSRYANVLYLCCFCIS